MQGLRRLLNALATGQAAAGVTGREDGWGCSSKELSFGALGRAWSESRPVRKQGKGYKEILVLHELGIVQDLCWKWAAEPGRALCSSLGGCCFAGKAAWPMEEGDSPPKSGERGQDCVLSCTGLLTLQRPPAAPAWQGHRPHLGDFSGAKPTE